MQSFIDFLVESQISDAEKVLGLSGDYTEQDVKSAYRRASSKAHPDKGGSTELQQKVNSAYELLKNSSKSQSREAEMEVIWKQYRETGYAIRDDLKSKFSIDAYSKYFSEVFGQEFSGLITDMTPEDKEWKRGGPSTATISAEWSNQDRTRVFQIGISVTLSDVLRGTGLATDTTTYNMFVTTFAYIDNRKVKITSRDYTNTSKKAVFTTPKTVFPKTKIVRDKKTKFKKSDMLSALGREIQAEKTNDFWFIPLKNDKFLALARHTMRRQGLWGIQGIWYKKSKYSWKRDESFDRVFMSLPETEETLNIFKKSKNMDPKQVLKMIETEYKKLIA